MIYAGQFIALWAYPFGERTQILSDGTSTMYRIHMVPRDFAIDAELCTLYLNVVYEMMTRVMLIPPASRSDYLQQVSVAYFGSLILEPKVAQYHPSLAKTWQIVQLKLRSLAAEHGRARIEQLAARAQTPQPTPAAGEDEPWKQYLAMADASSDF